MIADGGQPRVLVFLQRGLSLETWTHDRTPGDLNSATPYGYGEASGVVEMTWSRDQPENALASLVRRSLRRLLGFDLVHAWRHRREIDAADVVWTHTELESLGALAVMVIRRNRTTRLIAQTVWLWDEWDTRPAVLRRLYLSLLKRASLEVTLSTENRDRSRAERPGEIVEAVPFGAGVNRVVLDAVRDQVPARSGGYVLAVGSDRHRDWESLHAAARRLPDVEFRVATLSLVYPHETAPTNVAVVPSSSLTESYRAYHAASIVVLPLTPNLHASGCTVAIEAQSIGAPLVTTPVGGLAGYLDTDSVLTYRAGDSAHLADVLRTALAMTATSDRVADPTFVNRSGLTDADYAARFVILTRWLVAGAVGSVPESALSHASVAHLLD
jgi:glycosyltransferase involved in cell wall biosynthesis